MNLSKITEQRAELLGGQKSSQDTSSAVSVDMENSDLVAIVTLENNTETSQYASDLRSPTRGGTLKPPNFEQSRLNFKQVRNDLKSLIPAITGIIAVIDELGLNAINIGIYQFLLTVLDTLKSLIFEFPST